MPEAHDQRSGSQTALSRILDHPALTLGVWLALFVPCLVGLSHFRLDASSDSLVLEQDEDLRYYDDTRTTFGTDSSLIVVARPNAGVFEPATLEMLEALSVELAADEGVVSVLGVTRAPLFLSPPTGLFRLADGYRTIAADGVAPDMAQAEILSNPLYSSALISKDGRTTALQVSLAVEEPLLLLEQERYRYRDLEATGQLDSAGRRRLEEVEKEYHQEVLAAADRRQALISRLREVLDRHREIGLVELGGLPMITVDIIRYIRRDLVVFGVASILFVMLAVAVLFRSMVWTIGITLNCATTVLALLGILGWMDWRVTVVTSNLASLLFILTLAMSIHIAIRHRERTSVGEAESLSRSLAGALGHVFVPCVFTVLTTMVGFGSLYLSGLRPVMDFALMMAMGLALAFASCFLVLPSLIMLLSSRGGAGLSGASRSVVGTSGRLGEDSLFQRTGRWSLANQAPILVSAVAITAFSLMGIMRLGVENSFVDYFKQSTPIYRGMQLIDSQLGGTTPLEVVAELDRADGWLDMDRLAALGEFHDWLEQQPEIGHVSSLHSLIGILKQVIASDPNPALRTAQINTFILRTIRERVPEDVAASALRPFVSADYSQTRVTARVVESTVGIDREELLERIQRRLEEEPLVAEDKQRVTGMFVLYNNMLQSLFSSQVSTLAAVLIAIAVMFWLLLRSLRLSLIALVPNILPVCVVLGALGWAGVPLDMMTIMIAAITLGISVDDTVHYLYRYRRELQETGHVLAAVERSHDTVGRAMFATTAAVTFGFAILMISNFKPTIYFGLLTGLAMVTALLADAVLLPALLGLRRSQR